jgi:RNA polymerase sigma-70 factor (ECF subfamily)
MVSDEQIIKGCIKHKRRAFSLLYQKYGAVMLGVCMRYIGNRHEAEDVLQEGFIKIFKKIKTFEGRGSFEGWLKRIMVNTAINYLKSNKKFQVEEEFDANKINHTAGLSDEVTVEDDSEFNQVELISMIDDLPTGYKLIFNMYVLEGMTHKEIAESLGCSLGTSKSQLSKARKYLKKKLEERKLILEKV